MQRRGRVLRRAPGKESAVIYDFSPIPSQDSLRGKKKDLWRRQVETELARVRDFVSLAQNSEEQQIVINRAMRELALDAIYYEKPPVDEEELYGD